MPVVDRMLAKREQRALIVNPRHPRDPILATMFGEGNATAAGESVTPTTALQESAVLSAVRYIAETMASLPLDLLRRGSDPRVKEHATDRPLYQRLHDQPNRWQSSFDWIDMCFNHALLRGNFYNRLVASDELPPFELLPLHPDRVTPFWAPNGERAYAYQPPAGRPREIILQSEMFHLSFMPRDGLTGVSVISHARETIGRALAAARYGSNLYSNDGTPGGVLTHPKSLDPKVKDALREEWEKRHKGARNARRIAILQEGMKFEAIGISPEDAQHVQEMQFNKSDIAGIFRVPPHKIGDLSRSTFTNIEHQAIEAVVDTIRPWCVRWERRALIDLLTVKERAQYYLKFNVDGLLRGDSAARGEFYAKLFNIGALSQNDVREKEDLPPFTGGDEHYVPLNMMPVSRVLAEWPSPPPTPTARAARAARSGGPSEEQRTLRADRIAEHLRRLRMAYQPLFADAAGRLLRREADTVERQFKKLAQARTTRSIADFNAWLDSFYETFGEIASQNLRPVLLSYSQAVRDAVVDAGQMGQIDLDPLVKGFSETNAKFHARVSRQMLVDVTKQAPEDVMKAMDDLLTDWRTARAERMAAHEVVQAGNAFARESWRQVGVVRLMWVAGADACPLCESLDGEVVGIEQEFVSAGDLVGGDGVTTLKASKTLHPPLHTGCVCSVVPG